MQGSILINIKKVSTKDAVLEGFVRTDSMINDILSIEVFIFVV